MTLTIYGIHPVLEALRKRPAAFRRILILPAKAKVQGPLQQIVTLARNAGIPTISESPSALQKLARSEHHQGVAAEVAPFALTDLETIIDVAEKSNDKAFFLVLDSMQDPRNFGALIRSAVCSGVQAVLFPKDRAAPLTGTVAKASAGAIEHLQLCRVVNLAAALERLKQAGIWVIGTAPAGDRSIYEFDFDCDMALVVGSEEKGMRPLVHKKCDLSLAVPLQGSFDSLNASVAGAVVLFEAMRQRKYDKIVSDR